MAAQGAQAKAKESQAAVKALEGLVAAYNADLVPLPSADDEMDLVAQHMKLGHKGVLEIVEQNPVGGGGSGVVATGTAVSRIDLSAESSPPSSSSASSSSCPPAAAAPVLSWEDGAAANALQTLLHLRGGRIGWLPATSSSSSASPSPPLLFACVVSDSAEQLMENAHDTPSVAVPFGGRTNADSEPVNGGGLDDQLKELDSVKLKTLTEKADKVVISILFRFIINIFILSPYC